MKVNLGCGNDMRSGYINVDKMPQGTMPPDAYRQGDIGSLDWLAEDASIEEIVALDCVEYLPVSVMRNALLNWVQKLTQGGVLKILVPDCHAVAKAFALGQFNLSEYTTIMFGTQEHGDSRLSAIDTNTLLEILTGAGLTISLKRYDGVAVYVEAIK
jgi:predicted SAM-dependent methyltransferase